METSWTADRDSRKWTRLKERLLLNVWKQNAWGSYELRQHMDGRSITETKIVSTVFPCLLKEISLNVTNVCFRWDHKSQANATCLFSRRRSMTQTIFDDIIVMKHDNHADLTWKLYTRPGSKLHISRKFNCCWINCTTCTSPNVRSILSCFQAPELRAWWHIINQTLTQRDAK